MIQEKHPTEKSARYQIKQTAEKEIRQMNDKMYIVMERKNNLVNKLINMK